MADPSDQCRDASRFQRPWQVRACPADFAETFVREGWRGVEAKYGFHTRINKRCIAESGGAALIGRRRAFLAERRKPRAAAAATAAPDDAAPDVHAAIAFLRSREGGGWRVSATGAGDFWFESARIDAAAIVARAAARGFRPPA